MMTWTGRYSWISNGAARRWQQDDIILKPLFCLRPRRSYCVISWSYILVGCFRDVICVHIVHQVLFTEATSNERGLVCVSASFDFAHFLNAIQGLFDNETQAFPPDPSCLLYRTFWWISNLCRIALSMTMRWPLFFFVTLHVSTSQTCSQ